LNQLVAVQSVLTTFNQAFHPMISDIVKALNIPQISAGVHLGVFTEPYLQYIMDIMKTWESRLSKHKIAPYGKIIVGDIILLKKSCGPIVGLCQVMDIVSLNNFDINSLKQEYAALLMAGDDFFQSHEDALYATLMKIDRVTKLESPIQIQKKDRLGWIILHERPGMNFVSLESYR